MNQGANQARAWLVDLAHPICCDTSALYHPGPLRYLRQRFPNRRILLPAIAYFERQRQLRVRFGPDCDAKFLRQGLLEPLEIEIVACEESTALLLAQMAEQTETRALNDLMGSQTWSSEQARKKVIRAHAPEMRTRQANWRPLLQGERNHVPPCGQRCRLGDYVIAATARFFDALLLTSDTSLLGASEHYPDLFPPALRPELL